MDEGQHVEHDEELVRGPEQAEDVAPSGLGGEDVDDDDHDHQQDAREACTVRSAEQRT